MLSKCIVQCAQTNPDIQIVLDHEIAVDFVYHVIGCDVHYNVITKTFSMTIVKAQRVSQEDARILKSRFLKSSEHMAVRH